MAVCENYGCAREILNSGHGRRYCEVCSPPAGMRNKVCSHGAAGPCVDCWGVDYHQRRCRRRGGRLTLPYAEHLEQRITAVRERIAAELAALPASGLTETEIAGLDEALREELRSSVRELRRERAA